MVRHWTDDDTPREKFRLRPRHAFFLVDLAVIVLIFMAAGRLYVNSRGAKLVAEKKQERAAAQRENARMIAQADSVVAAAQDALGDMKSEHAGSVDELMQLKQQLEAEVPRTKQLEQGIFRLSDTVLDLRQRTTQAVKDVKSRERNLEERKQEVDSLRTKEERTATLLDETRSAHTEALQELSQARQEQAHDPKGLFPRETGMAFRRDISKTQDLSNLELQHLFWNSGMTNVGVSFGFGLGAGNDVASNKEVGLLLSRPLIHRRLGLDLGAGFSQLTYSGGGDDNGAYASAALRLSPFYRERFHVGLGARAGHGDVVPFLGFSLGR